MIVRRLLTTAAIVAMAGAANAAQPAPQDQPMQQQTSATAPQYLQLTATNAHLASDLIGESVYSSDSKDAETVGDINDLVVREDGSIDAVVIGVGGFLGVGEKNVAVRFDSIKWSIDQSGNRYAVLTTSKEDLQNAPSFDVSMLTPSTAPKDQTRLPATANNDQPAPPAPMAAPQPPAQTAMSDQSGKAPAPAAEAPATQPQQDMTAQSKPLDNNLAAENKPADSMAAQDKGQMASNAANTQPASTISADDLIDATVYGADNSDLGNVSDVLLASDGSVDAIVVDVGGFLGLGAKPVAIGFDSVQFRTDDSGKLIVETSFTKDALDAAPQYDESAYAQQRDTMRLTNGG